MGTLSSELTHVIVDSGPVPRIYADANIPTGVVEFMRNVLGWDVFFVLEHDDIRRAADLIHKIYHNEDVGPRAIASLATYVQVARDEGATDLAQLRYLDRDYVDDHRFPPSEGAGVIVFSAPDERWLRKLMRQVDRRLFRAAGARALPLEGRKVQWHIDEPNDP